MATRYWKGKAPKGVAHIDSDSDDEDVPPQEEAADIQIGGKAMNISLKNVSISQDGKVNVPGRQESGQTAGEDGMS
jgi:microfibrillar-associated protein 1